MSTTGRTKVPVQFTDGCAVTDDIAYVAAVPDTVDDDEAYTRLFALNTSGAEQWFHHDWPGARVVSVCLRRQSPEHARAVCALADSGAVEIANSGGQSVEQVAGAGLGPGSRGLGHLRRIREVNGQLMACGAGNQVYLRTNQGWRAVDQALTAQVAAAQARVLSLLSSPADQVDEAQLLALTNAVSSPGSLDDIDGMAADDVYVCGVDGGLWHWSGTAWAKVPIRTDDHLHALHAVSRSEVWVCGHNGTLLLGDASQGFRSLIGPEVSDHFWSVRRHEGLTYLGSSGGLLVWDGRTLNSVRLPGSPAPAPIQSLDGSANALWVFTDRFVARLLDGRWARFDHPDNI